MSLNISIDDLKRLAKNSELENKRFAAKIKKRTPANFDDSVHSIHHEIFSQIDCLQCANCCRNLGPRITEADITKLSKKMHLKPSAFVEKYLRIDQDMDYVFKTMPCPFLAIDNYCMVYENRPKACAEYPHTDRRRFFQLLDISVKNTFTCPAVLHILESLKKRYSD